MHRRLAGIKGTYFTITELTEHYKRAFGTEEAVVSKPLANYFLSQGKDRGITD